MIKILFVCHGNICRSPMAEFLLKDMVAKLEQTANFEIASAATSREEIGNPVHYGTRRKLAQLGISVAGKTARQMTRQDYEYYDYIVAMDKNNLRNIDRIIGSDTLHKVRLLLDFTQRQGQSIADPWYTGDFEVTYADIMEGLQGLLDKVMFKCDGCGLCCQQLQLNPMMAQFHNGDGVCYYLDQATHRCTIYKERPLLCRVDVMYDMLYKDKMSREEFYALNYAECRKLKQGRRPSAD